MPSVGSAVNSFGIHFVNSIFEGITLNRIPPNPPVPFHRVIDGFMAQTGDPCGDGTGGSGVNIPAEFSDEPYERGTLGMARASDPDSADSQFFIMLERYPSLDGKYTVWGKVTEGMDYVWTRSRRRHPIRAAARWTNPTALSACAWRRTSRTKFGNSEPSKK